MKFVILKLRQINFCRHDSALVRLKTLLPPRLSKLSNIVAFSQEFIEIELSSKYLSKFVGNIPGIEKQQ